MLVVLNPLKDTPAVPLFRALVIVSVPM